MRKITPMNKEILFAALLIFGAASVSSYAGGNCTGGDDAEILQQHEFKLAEAVGRRDIKVVGGIYSDGSVRTHSYSGELSKEQYLSRLKANADKIESVSVSDIKVRFYVDTAVVSGRLMVRGRNPETDYAQQYQHLDRFTHTFVRQQERWRLVAAHETVMQAFGIHTDY
jgi:hypothetical protein